MGCKNSMEGLGECRAAAVSRTGVQVRSLARGAYGSAALKRAPGAVAGDD
jgi:hypothetical protein